jgi:uncharacterized repeat protein (TIGR03803 family)
MEKLDWRNRACAAVLLCVTTAIGVSAQTFKTLHRFDGTDGASGPDGGIIAGLVQATGGNLYGTTARGGEANNGGTVFKINPGGGPVKTLYSFCPDCTDGFFPTAGVVQAAGGNFYGTTCGAVCGASGSDGTIFKITPSGLLTTLYSFCPLGPPCTDGAFPQAGLVQATNGNFYGTTSEGGANTTDCGGTGCGTVFKITPSGTLTTLYSFCSQSGCTDGNTPNGLVHATNGNLYGTTYQGGVNGDGTVFRITASGTLTTLHHFKGPDGAQPAAALVQATDGNLYGTTFVGGANKTDCHGYGCGTVFKITPGGTLTTLYSFCSQGGTACTDGDRPEAALVQASDGNFYGTTVIGGANTTDCGGSGCGTVFKITPSGTLTTLYSFCSQSGCTDGDKPFAAVVQDTNGMFYGTTSYGGNTTDCFGSGCGTVFSLSVGLGPFVKTQPDWGRAGRFVEILGTNLNGATSVTFNGTPAAFRVVLNSLIKTTVPAGATTGTVQVVTPGGTLASNVPFRVLP